MKMLPVLTREMAPDVLTREWERARVNAKIDRAVFDPDLTGYEVKDARD